LTRTTRAGLVLAGVLLAALVASGAWLWWNYRPDRDQWIRTTHQAAAIALLAVAVGLVVLAILRRARTGGAGVVAAVGVLLTTGGAYVLGRLLPYDQLAFSAVIDRNASLGVARVFSGSVKFVVLGDRLVSPSTYRWWAIAHLVLSVLAVVALGLLWLRSRERVVSRPSPPAAPAEQPAR
jgi:hypothetical protein